ncbi:MAG TPA: HPr family phosphocarrier protein [Candidatus Blautia merdavium]|uniref:HPr family phosphocarrier protein n=1 Tax=Candidatus Blautia merdavium TaxID=2838494 RepID=A0A9D2PMB4_9FIRM|nr:HPr family phosphocarrier protein [Candidatus Blautia merdavium]
MCERTVRFRHAEDIRDFVRAACRCSFDIDVISDRLVIDAKSILGVLSLDCNKELSVRYEERDPQFENILGKYAVV